MRERALPSWWVNFWLHLYDAIRGELGFSLRADLDAAKAVDTLLYDAFIRSSYVSLNDLCESIRGYSVCIVGASSDVEDKIEVIEKKCRGAVIAAADGVSKLLLDYSIEPSLVFSDLDGSWQGVLEASRRGAIVIVHSHGDNIHAVKAITPRLERVHATVQAMPSTGLMLASVLGGFTDGDRALAAAVACRAAGITLIGMRLGGKTSRYSKPWLKSSVTPWESKRKKLLVAAKLVSLLYRIAAVKGIRVEWA